MVQINLPEFVKYDLTQFIEFIRLQDETEYNITFPKKTIAGKQDNYQVFWEYHHAAYIGQKLYELADSFSYTVPCVRRSNYFSFQVSTSDTMHFAATLFYLICGLSGHKDKALSEKFNLEAARLLEAAFDGKKDAACWGLIWIANWFLVNI